MEKKMCSKPPWGSGVNSSLSMRDTGAADFCIVSILESPRFCSLPARKAIWSHISVYILVCAFTSYSSPTLKKANHKEKNHRALISQRTVKVMSHQRCAMFLSFPFCKWLSTDRFYHSHGSNLRINTWNRKDNYSGSTVAVTFCASSCTW